MFSSKKVKKTNLAAKQKGATPSKPKTKVATKRKRLKLAKPKGEAAATREGVVPGRHWTILVKPMDSAFIAQMLRPCHLIIKNHGPGNVKLYAHNGDLMDLNPGNLRATYVSGEITVKSTDNKSALIELELSPVFLRY
jgi:hypothetical protein